MRHPYPTPLNWCFCGAALLSLADDFSFLMTMRSHLDEQSPLLSPRTGSKIPWFQFSILMLVQLSDPFSSQVIYPFVPELIRDMGITRGNESHVGYYIGLMQSLFYLAQAIGVLFWSRMSDHFGRKPSILIGLAGVSVSSFCFGLSKSFWSLVLSRCLSGAFNGNVGVIKTMMAELTDTDQLPKVNIRYSPVYDTRRAQSIYELWALLPLSSSMAVAVGPLIGGYLSRPADRFPCLFGQNQFLKTYPYFLPCAFPAALSAVSWVVTSYLLEETVKSPAPISQLFQRRKIQNVDGPVCIGVSTFASDKPAALRSVLIPRVIIAVGNYALVALIAVAFRAIQPLFFATPIEFGGLGLPPSKIGVILSLSGVLAGVVQIFFSARIHNRLGSKKTFVVGLTITAPLFLTFPITSALAKACGFSALLWGIIGVQALLSLGFGMSFGAIFMYITAASPNRASLGATHGLSQMSISIVRAIGPAAANGLFSFSIEHGYLDGYLVFYVLFVVTCIGMSFTSLLPRKVWN